MFSRYKLIIESFQCSTGTKHHAVGLAADLLGWLTGCFRQLADQLIQFAFNQVERNIIFLEQVIHRRILLVQQRFQYMLRLNIRTLRIESDLLGLLDGFSCFDGKISEVHMFARRGLVLIVLLLITVSVQRIP